MKRRTKEDLQEKPGLKPVLDCGEAARYIRRAKRLKRGAIYPREMIEACNRFLRKRGVE